MFQVEDQESYEFEMVQEESNPSAIEHGNSSSSQIQTTEEPPVIRRSGRLVKILLCMDKRI